MKSLRVMVVAHASLVPPDDLGGVPAARLDEMRTEIDVITTLKSMGHEVLVVGVLDSLTELRTVMTDWRPDIAFNLLEEFDGIVTYDQHVVAFLELSRQRYTGCNPRGLLLSRDKPLSKQLLSYHRIPTPQFTVFRRGARLHVPRKLRYPLFVKSATEDASLGISQASIVADLGHLRERVAFIHDQVGSDALVEEYIDGREVYVGVLGNDRLTRYPPWELSFGSLPEGQAPIATRKIKWDKRYQQKHGIATQAANDLEAAVVTRLDQLARRIYRVLGLSGYARMDFRIRPDGGVFVLEANANPNLAQGEDLAQSALAAGTGYDELLTRILQLGLRYQAEWRSYYT
jgi:D-alanine-D-alanine ligase